jgi:NAD(P)H dehydrogenase (quinone)
MHRDGTCPVRLPYGASHVSGPEGNAEISSSEKALALALGKHLAQTALKLAS